MARDLAFLGAVDASHSVLGMHDDLVRCERQGCQGRVHAIMQEEALPGAGARRDRITDLHRSPFRPREVAAAAETSRSVDRRRMHEAQTQAVLPDLPTTRIRRPPFREGGWSTG